MRHPSPQRSVQEGGRRTGATRTGDRASASHRRVGTESGDGSLSDRRCRFGRVGPDTTDIDLAQDVRMLTRRVLGAIQKVSVPDDGQRA